MGNMFGVVHKTVAVAGTRERLVATGAAVRFVASVTIQVKLANTGKVFAGDETVNNLGTSGLTLGIPAVGGTPPLIAFSSDDGTNSLDMAEIWLDVGVSGEGVVALYLIK